MPPSPTLPRDPKALGATLKAWRAAARPGGLTQEDLADAIGYSRSRVAIAETGHEVPVRDFWARADEAVGAGGALMQAYELYLGYERVQARLAAEGRPSPGPIALADQAADAVRLATELDRPSVCAHDLDVLEGQLRHLVAAYRITPIEDLTHSLATARDLAASLFDIVRGIGPLRRLHLLTARLTGVLAHLLVDTGDLRRSADAARAAWRHAELADDAPTLAWIRSVQSLTAFWSGSPRAAAALAADGAARISGGVHAVRLAGLEARARGRLGDLDGVTAAIDRAACHRDRLPAAAAEPGGLMCFPAAKESAYATTALLALGDSPRLAEAADRAERTVSLMAGIAGPDPLAAGLDLAGARLLTGAVDGALTAVEAVATAPVEARTATIRIRASALAALTRSRHHQSTDGRAMVNLLDALARPAGIEKA